MGFSLKGFATGLATAAGEVMDEERKQTNNLIAQRTKNSFENYTKYQETTEALRADIKKKDTMLMNWQPDLTEQERIAAAGIPNLVDMYQRLVADGKQVSVRDMIKVSEKSAGMKFDNYVTELGKIAPAQGLAPVTEAKFLGPSEESQRKAAEKYAATTGVPEAELRAFQAMPRTADVSSMGSLNIDVFKKAPKQPSTVEDVVATAKLAQFNAERDKGKDSPEFKAATATFNMANSYLENAKESLNSRADSLRNRMIDETDPAAKKALGSELKLVEQSILGHKLATSIKDTSSDADKKKTYAQIKTSVNDFVNTRMRDEEGASWRKYVDFKTTKMEDGTTFVSRTQKAEMPLEEQKKMFAAEQNLTKQALFSNGYLTPTGAPVYNAVREIMNNMNIPVGQAAPAPEGTPAPVAAPAPMAAPTALPSKSATLGVASAGRTAAPAAQPAAPDVAKLRNEASAAIKLGADRTKIAERFKKATGQEL